MSFFKNVQKEGCKLVVLEDKGHAPTLGGLEMEMDLNCWPLLILIRMGGNLIRI
jgi:hypothetical protein